MDDISLNERKNGGDEENQDDNQHDQLPTVEQYKTQIALNAKGSSDHWMWGAIYGIIALVIAVFLIVIGVVIGRDTSPSDEAGSNPTARPAPAPKPVPAPTQTFPQEPSQPAEQINRDIVLGEFVAEQKWSDFFQVSSPGTPQYKAIKWMAHADPKNLEVSAGVEFKERYAAAVLFFAFEGVGWPHNANDFWLSEKPVCEWSSVFLENVNFEIEQTKVGIDCFDTNTVQTIFLPGLRMEGFLPPEISLFSNLVNLDLSHNKITYVSKELTKLQRLNWLNLEDNKLLGTFPSWIGDLTSLSVLNLKRNNLSGTIPTTFQNMHELHTLNLEYNSLSGDIQQLKGLNQIQAMLLGGNNITGPFYEDVFVTWENIQALDMSENQLTGALPEKLFALSSLAVLDLSGNKFQGNLPDLVAVESDVRFLALQDNSLSGGLENLRHMEQLEHLDLSHNEFVGTMPSEFGGLVNLRYLFLAFNKFQYGEIPTEFGLLINLEDLSLQDTNRLKRIPTELGKLEKLVLLDLNQNTLTGDIPGELGNLIELNFLLLKDNKLSGSIPESFANLKRLDSAVIDNNFLSGSAAPFCDPRLPLLTEVISDCADLTCTCCQCCAKDDPDCNAVVWFSGLDPVYSPAYRFERQFYAFHENFVEYPVSDEHFIWDDTSEPDTNPESDPPATDEAETDPAEDELKDAIDEELGEILGDGDGNN
jgi:Leucine-rich repeat (LRR) protein